MVRKKKHGLRDHILGLIIMVGVCGGALAFASGIGVDNLSQLAVLNAADLMCVGGADAVCKCNTGFKPGTKQCDGKTKGGGKIECPCKDITSGDVAASGKCATVGKCKADKADGMMPMLPMIPMMMPKMEMPMMPKPCVPKTASTTSATSSPATSTATITPNSWTGGEEDCQDFGTGGTGGAGGASWFPNFGGVSDMFNSPDDADSSGAGDSDPTDSGANSGSGSLWGRLMQSLGLSVDSEDGSGSGGSGGGGGAIGTTTGNVQSKQGGETAKSTSGATADFAIIGSGSTFSYAEDVSFAEASVLDEIAQTLKSLLAIVTSWF